MQRLFFLAARGRSPLILETLNPKYCDETSLTFLQLGAALTTSDMDLSDDLRSCLLNSFHVGGSQVPNPAPYTPNPTLQTLHPTPYTLHSTLHTLHTTPHTLQPTPYSLEPYTLEPSNPKSGTLDLGLILRLSLPESEH
jgi:hypothetical protein